MDNLRGKAWSQDERISSGSNVLPSKKAVSKEEIVIATVETINVIDSLIINIDRLQTMISNKHIHDIDVYTRSIAKIAKDFLNENKVN